MLEGNENVDACTVSPAYSTNAITVGSYDKRRDKSSFSNWGDCVDIWAPGTSIYSAVASDKDSKYEYKQGTSMASPYIAGMVANLLYINPTLTFDDIKHILLDTTKSVSGDKCNDYSCPRAQYTCQSALVYDLPYKLSTLDIVLIVLGSIAGVCIITIIIMYCVKKKKQRDQNNQNENDWQYNQREYEKEMNKKKGKSKKGDKVKVHDNSHEAEMQHINPNTDDQPQQLVVVEE